MVALMGAARAELPAGAFVRAEGTGFTVGGRRFTFVGANAAVNQGQRNRERYRDTIAAVAADGGRVARVWAFGEGPADATEWFRKDHLFRAGPDGFIEESYQQLDRVLAAARADGVRLIVTLSNNWADYGGLPMYLRWGGLADDDVEAFYRDERLRAWYRAGVDKLLQRTNSVTGVRYADDPTIFAWELMNESTVVTPEQAEARRRWIVEMARFIKARDPNHMVSAGVAGYGSRAERAEWIRVCALREVDYCDSHLYPQTTDLVDRWKRLDDFVDDRAQVARFVVGKPLVIGEFGFHTDGDGARGWLGLARPALFRRFLARLALDGVAGALVWIYQPWPGRARDFGIYVDRRDTDDVRGALRAMAARLTGLVRNPRLGAAVGERLLYDAFVTVRGPSRRHDRWWRRDGGRLLEIPPGEFADARFERAGAWDKSALAHAYGAGAGRFRYRFASPGGQPARLVVRARLSSEWPGYSAPPDGGSPVEVLLDGARIAALQAVPDDGAGTWHEVAVEDPALLRRIAAPGAHTLTFAVPDRPESHGLCIYGSPTGNGPPPVGEAAPIQIWWR